MGGKRYHSIVGASIKVKSEIFRDDDRIKSGRERHEWIGRAVLTMTLEWYGIGCGGSICLPFAFLSSIFNGRLPHFVSGLRTRVGTAKTLLLPPPSHRQDVHHSDVVS